MLATSTGTILSELFTSFASLLCSCSCIQFFILFVVIVRAFRFDQIKCLNKQHFFHIEAMREKTTECCVNKACKGHTIVCECIFAYFFLLFILTHFNFPFIYYYWWKAMNWHTFILRATTKKTDTTEIVPSFNMHSIHACKKSCNINWMHSTYYFILKTKRFRHNDKETLAICCHSSVCSNVFAQTEHIKNSLSIYFATYKLTTK